MKEREKYILIIYMSAFLLFLFGCDSKSESQEISDETPQQTIGGDFAPESLQPGEFTLICSVLASFPGGTYYIEVDEDGILLMEYALPHNLEAHEALRTRPLSEEEQIELIDVIFANDFFNLPKKLTDTSSSDMPGSTAVYISIKHDGQAYSGGGPGDGTEATAKFLAIFRHLAKLAVFPDTELDDEQNMTGGQVPCHVFHLQSPTIG